MDRKTMINEVAAAAEGMGLEPAARYSTKNLSGYNTARLESLHRRVMEQHRAWMAEEDASIAGKPPEEDPPEAAEPEGYVEFVESLPVEKDPYDECPGVAAVTKEEETLDTLPEDPKTGEVPGYMTIEYLIFLDQLREEGSVNMYGAAPELAREFGITKSLARSVLGYWMRTFGTRHPKLHEPEKESEMKDDKKKKSDKKKSATPKKEAPFVVTERLAFEALAATVWEEADRPDITSMTDSAVAEELKESISLLAPEDEVTVLNMDHGPELWAYLSGMMKDRATLAVKAKKEKAPKEPKVKNEKAEKAPGPPGVISSIKEFLISSGEGGISKKGILTKLVERFPGKKEDSMKATINVQVPSRLAKENNLTIKKLTADGETRYLIA